MKNFKIGNFVVARVNKNVFCGMVVDIDVEDDYLEIAMDDGNRKIVRKSFCKIDPFPEEEEE